MRDPGGVFRVATPWFFWIFLLSAWFIPSVYGQSAYPTPPPLLVITDLKSQGEASAAEAAAFSEFIRREVTRSGLYRVIDKQSMYSILQAHRFPWPCFELREFLAMGRLLGADRVLAGHVDRQGEKVGVTVRLIDCASADFLLDLFREKSPCAMEDLIGEWGRSIISELFSIPLEKLSTPTPFPELRPTDTPTPKIPDEILNKYPGMVYVPGGKFVFGSDNGDPCESPCATVDIPSFYIDKTEVTNAAYKRFTDATGHRTPVHWERGVIPPGLEDHPVAWVNWEDATAYAKWSGARLPTEREWEKAARGTDGRIYPWGDYFDSTRCNTWESGIRGTASVGSFPEGESPYHVLDMAGNVAEWVADRFQPYPNTATILEKYSENLRVLRGGSWTFNEYYARASHRYPRSPQDRHGSYGFRTARDAEPSRL